MLRAVQQGEFPPPRRHDPSIDRALEAVCLKAMAHRPADRYASPQVAGRGRRAVDGRRAGVGLARAAIAAGAAVGEAEPHGGDRGGGGAGGRGGGPVGGVGGTDTSQSRCRASAGPRNARPTRALTAANEDLRESNVRERVSRERRSAASNWRRQAIEQYHTGASEDVLLKQPELEALRKTLLGTALAFYKRLHAELDGAQDPATRAELASAFTRVGEITAEVGIAAEALEAYQRARAIHEELVRADPSAAGPRRELAGDLERIGGLLTSISGREDEALPLLERALALRAALANNAADGRATAETYLVIASNRALVGRAAEALRAIEASKEVAERVLVNHPEDDAARQTLSAGWSRLAYRQAHLGRYDAARDSLEQALAAPGAARGPASGGAPIPV